MPQQAVDPSVQLVADHLQNPQGREALMSLVSEVVNTWQNLDLFCTDGRAQCRQAVHLARLQQLLHLLGSPLAGKDCITCHPSTYSRPPQPIRP